MPAAAPIDPRHLIDHARDLAHHHIGPGSLRPVYLRRAASAAYYAFFHAMALRVSQQVLPNGSAEDRQRRSRSVGHAELRDVCQWIIGPSGAGKRHVQPIVATLQQDGRVVRIAGIAFRLQEERHRADYDHLATFGKAAVLSLINEAELALNELDHLLDNPEFERLIALVALHTRLA